MRNIFWVIYFYFSKIIATFAKTNFKKTNKLIWYHQQNLRSSASFSSEVNFQSVVTLWDVVSIFTPNNHMVFGNTDIKYNLFLIIYYSQKGHKARNYVKQLHLQMRPFDFLRIKELWKKVDAKSTYKRLIYIFWFFLVIW